MGSNLPVLTDVHQATPEWLTTILRGAGILRNGRVDHVQIHPNEAFNSVVAHLEVTYSETSSLSLPSYLLLKLNRHHHGALEHIFYQSSLDAQSDSLPIVRCYDTAYSSQTGASHCLLADLSHTHSPPVTREHLLAQAGIPSMLHLEQIVDTIAQFHAYWWQHPQLGTGDDLFAIRHWYRDHTFYRRHVERRKTEWAQFTGAVGDELPVELRALYTDVLTKLPDLWDRYLAPRLTPAQNITVTHGDCYLTQFLCPKRAEAGTTYLVDFDSVSANFGAFDLAYLIPTFWTRSQRYEQNREQHVLRQYHQALEKYGVRQYDWDTLLTDYKVMVTLMLFDPIWDQTSGASRAYWWPKLHSLADAYSDLNCAALFTA